jgi:hypothetical protein
MADLADGIFDRRSGDESRSIAENLPEDIIRSPAVATTSPSQTNTDNDFVRPEHVSQKRSRLTNEFPLDALPEPEPAGDAPLADDVSVLQEDAAKRRRMHLAFLARWAGFSARAGSQNTGFARPGSRFEEREKTQRC